MAFDKEIWDELKSSMGESFPMIVQAFCNSSEKHINHIKDSLLQGRNGYEQIADSAHALKSISAQIGALHVADISGQMEEVALRGREGIDERKIQELYHLLAASLSELKIILEQEI